MPWKNTSNTTGKDFKKVTEKHQNNNEYVKKIKAEGEHPEILDLSQNHTSKRLLVTFITLTRDSCC